MNNTVTALVLVAAAGQGALGTGMLVAGADDQRRHFKSPVVEERDAGRKADPVGSKTALFQGGGGAMQH